MLEGLFYGFLCIPLLGFLTVYFLQSFLSARVAGWLAFAGLLLSGFAYACVGWSTVLPKVYLLYDWLAIGSLHVPVSFVLDQVTFRMGALILTVAGCVYLYAISYMALDKHAARFFAYLQLFVFFMLLLVFSNQLLGLFAGWEGVGFCSYLLIGFWYTRSEYVQASEKAFLINRVGDIAMVLGIVLTWVVVGALDYGAIFGFFTSPHPLLGVILVLFCVGAFAKSAQFPLFTWLSDAMAGPTPVSALMHAATMVTAGVFFLIRLYPLFAVQGGWYLDMLVIVGLVTAFLAGFLALFVGDIKKVLAYSTVSQIGIMVCAVGLDAPESAFFHLITHGFFKALLFLSAGSVIHALSGEQSIQKMGGLLKKIPITATLFGIGLLALMGIAPMSGFFSKDAILILAFRQNPLAFWMQWQAQHLYPL